MAGALAVFMPSYPLVMRRARPVAAEKFDLQNARRVTVELVAGAAIFGVGWGICGVCPAAARARWRPCRNAGNGRQPRHTHELSVVAS